MFNKNLSRVTLLLLLCFGAVALSLTYWSVFAIDGMVARFDNPRRVEAERAIQRGTIYDRNGEVLARSVEVGRSPAGLPIWRRQYPSPAAVGATGYFSRFYGSTGIEEAFNAVLNGEDLRDKNQVYRDSLLHRIQVGSDLRTTIDRGLQAGIAEAFGKLHGAAVVIDVPSGAILAMVNAPGFDPNTVDEAWDKLRIDPAQPLKNLSLEGSFFPGGTLQTVILTAMLTDQKMPPEPLGSAMIPITAGGFSQACAGSLPAETVKLAYALSCPYVFSEAILNDLGPARAWEIVKAFGLLNQPTLANFTFKPVSTPRSFEEITDPEQLRAASIGQGGLRVSPLQIALIAAAIANHGNAVDLHLVTDTRAPGAQDWQALLDPKNERAITTREVTMKIREAMREAVLVGAAKAAGQETAGALLPKVTLYGHASMAYEGTGNRSANTWFIGFVDLPDGRSIAVAVVVQNTVNIDLAAGIGGKALAEAAKRTALPTGN